MKYMLLMYADPHRTQSMTDAEREVIARKHKTLVASLTDSGELLGGEGLDYPWNTVTLHWNQGDLFTSEGPLYAAQEHLTAYYVVNCENADRAQELARELLDFHVMAVEVRPIHT